MKRAILKSFMKVIREDINSLNSFQGFIDEGGERRQLGPIRYIGRILYI